MAQINNGSGNWSKTYILPLVYEENKQLMFLLRKEMLRIIKELMYIENNKSENGVRSETWKSKRGEREHGNATG